MQQRYARGFDADRKLIAQEMDTGFFSKVGEHSQAEISSDMLEQLREMLQQHPELLSELIKGQEDAAAKGDHKHSCFATHMKRCLEIRLIRAVMRA